MSYNPNRLQFVHCDTCFENSEKAREYVTGGNLITRDRPALYAEPMVLKYGDPKNPNILLAIGSVGDGKTNSVDNKVFFIDCAQLDIDNNFVFVDTNTIAFSVNKHESGTTVESDILLQPTKIVDKYEYDNIILNEEGGLFTYVNTEVVDDQVVVNVNGNIKSYTLPDPVVRGEYNKETLKLTLFTKKDEPIVIDFNDVVLMSDNDNNILVKRLDGLYASVDVDYDTATDTLTFNNGIAEKKMALLSVAQDTINKNVEKELESLAIKPIATSSISSIAQKTNEGTTIESNVLLSVDSKNILRITDAGVYATVDVEYDSTLNKLTLLTSSGKKEINLINQSFLESISYDSIQKKIIMKVKLNDNNVVTQEIDMGDLFNPINVSNDVDSPIILTKNTNSQTGIDTISAFLQVSVSDDNLIKVRSEGSTSNLFASNRASSIKMDWHNKDEDDRILTIDQIDVQSGFARVTSYISSNNKEIRLAKERITELEKQLEKLTLYISQLTDFGHTEDLLNEQELNA
jgi:hypothetical protein